MTGPSFIQLDSGHDTGATSLEDTPILGPKWIKLPALTVGFVGLQALWSVEMSYGATTSKPEPIHHFYPNHVSFTVPTISGAVKIPHGDRVSRRAVIWPHRSATRRYSRQSRRSTTSVLKSRNAGVLADNSKSRFGRRRPFMIGGAIITAVATLLFGFTRPVAGIFSEEGSGLVCTSGPRTGGGRVLIAHPVQGSVNMACHIRHLCHGFLNKRRHVQCDSRFVPSLTPPPTHSPSR